MPDPFSTNSTCDKGFKSLQKNQFMRTLTDQSHNDHYHIKRGNARIYYCQKEKHF